MSRLSTVRSRSECVRRECRLLGGGGSWSTIDWEGVSDFAILSENARELCRKCPRILPKIDPRRRRFVYFRKRLRSVSRCPGMAYGVSEIRTMIDSPSCPEDVGVSWSLPSAEKKGAGARRWATHASAMRLATPYRKPFPAAGGSACGPKGLSRGGLPHSSAWVARCCCGSRVAPMGVTKIPRK